MASFDRARSEALACLARDRKLEDFDLGLLDTKNDGWSDEVLVRLCGL